MRCYPDRADLVLRLGPVHDRSGGHGIIMIIIIMIIVILMIIT